jgi:hypothetical protein
LATAPLARRLKEGVCLVCHRHWGLKSRFRLTDIPHENLANTDELYEHLPGFDVPNVGFWEGYVDAQAGRDLDYDFGAEDPTVSFTYEAGFELGARLLARGHRMSWRDRRYLPQRLVALAEQTAKEAGDER